MGLPKPASARDTSHCSLDWQPSRHSEHPRKFLKAFPGTVITDGYPTYHKLVKEHRNLKVADCWVHTRRPFAEFIKSVGQDTAKGAIAQETYLMITEIMHIDNTFDDLVKNSVSLFFLKK